MTHEQFLNQLIQLNPHLKVLSEYLNSRTKVLVRCKRDEHEWEVTPSNLLQGRGCPKCGSTGKTHQAFLEDLERVNKYVEVLGEYVNTRTKILVRCTKDGCEWEALPSSLLSGCGCPKCCVSGKMKSHKTFIEEIKEKYGDSIEVLSDYTGSRQEIRVRHLDCGREFIVLPTSLLRGRECPFCKTLKPEVRELADYFTQKEIPYKLEVSHPELRNTETGDKLMICVVCKTSDGNLAIDYGESEFTDLKRAFCESIGIEYLCVEEGLVKAVDNYLDGLGR